jgi:hypothetical protein
VPTVAGTARPAGAATTFDWALATVNLPHQVSGHIEVRLTFTGERAGLGPEVVGQSTWMPGFGTDSAVWVAGPGPVVASASTPAGSRTVTAIPLTTGLAPGFGVVCSPCTFGSGAVIRLLGFDTDARFDSVTATASAAGEELPVTVTTGSGSSRIDIAGDGSTGTAVATGEVAAPAGPIPVAVGAAAGSTTVTMAVPAGVVGALSAGCAAGDCIESWRAPDGRTRTITHSALVLEGSVSGPFKFSGPAGPWTFSWSGVSRETVVGAFAPIGTDWLLFS